MKPIRLALLVSTFAIISGNAVMAGEAWVNLFNGKDLTGWEEHNGTAKYSVADGVLTGTTVSGSPNSFLCTKRNYANFELELEFKCDPLLNSGVQIRSEIADHEMSVKGEGTAKPRILPVDRLHGYQCEIDMDVKRGRMWTAGIQEEAGRAWLQPDDGEKGPHGKAFSEQGRKVSKPGEWNKLRIVADGPSIKTWLNGEPRADLKDSVTASGLIALQVHGIGADEKKAGLTVSFRNIRVMELPATPPVK